MERRSRRTPVERQFTTTRVVRNGCSRTTPASVWTLSAAHRESTPRALPDPRPPTNRTTSGCWQTFVRWRPGDVPRLYTRQDPTGLSIEPLITSARSLWRKQDRCWRSWQEGWMASSLTIPEAAAASGTILISSTHRWARLWQKSIRKTNLPCPIVARHFATCWIIFARAGCNHSHVAGNGGPYYLVLSERLGLEQGAARHRN